jgi:HEXXH motif-containing protein
MNQQNGDGEGAANLQRFFVPEGAPELCRALAVRRSLLRWSLLSELAANPEDAVAAFLDAEIQELTPSSRHEVLGSPDLGVLLRGRMAGEATPAADLVLLGAVAVRRSSSAKATAIPVRGELRLSRQPIGPWMVVREGEPLCEVCFAMDGAEMEFTGTAPDGLRRGFRLSASTGAQAIVTRQATCGDIWEVADGWQCYLDTFDDGNTSLGFSDVEREVLRVTLDQAAGLVRKVAPGLPEEMAETARYLSPIAPQRPDAGIPSFSSRDYPGVIFIGTHDSQRRPLDWQHLVESCVHEHLHNRLYLLETAHPLTAPAAANARARTYHSPWKRRGRPIDGIMHAIYVFAYLAWFWDRVRQSDESATLRGFAHERCEEQREAVGGALRSVEDTDELSLAGNAVIDSARGLARQLGFV